MTPDFVWGYFFDGNYKTINEKLSLTADFAKNSSYFIKKMYLCKM